MTQETHKNLIIVSVILVSLGLIYHNQIGNKIKEEITEAAVKEQPKVVVDYFKDVHLEAKSGYVLDVFQNKVIFNKNAGEQLPLASLTKIMTAIVAKEVYNLNNKYLTEESFKELTTTMLVESSNDAASIIAKSMEAGGAINFVGLMNKKAGEMGLPKTIFSNPTGLDLSSTAAGAYGSAEEVAKLLLYGYKKYPDVFEVTKYAEVESNGQMIANKNELVKKLPNIVAGKTGLTDLAGGNLAVLFGSGQQLFAVVVLGSTEQGRFSDVEILINTITQYLQQ